MTKQEFLDTLRRALASDLSESEVADNINYYWNYMEQQIASGKSEEQVLSELGDPRLIARTIRQVDQQKEEEAEGIFTHGADDRYTEDEMERGDAFDDLFEDRRKPHDLTVKDKLRIVLVILLILIVIGAVFHILWTLLPFLIVAALVLWIYRKWRG